MAGVAVRGAGGRSYRFTWQGDAVRGRIQERVLRDVESMAALIETYLRSELHRDTGDMADKSFARVDVQGEIIIIRAGSESDHTIYHELRYHPQLRQTLDEWGPRLTQVVRKAMNLS